MLEVLRTAFSHHPMTCAILLLYVSNIAWYSFQREWGSAWYWVAAAQITVAATWFVGKH